MLVGARWGRWEGKVRRLRRTISMGISPALPVTPGESTRPVGQSAHPLRHPLRPLLSLHPPRPRNRTPNYSRKDRSRFLGIRRDPSLRRRDHRLLRRLFGRRRLVGLDLVRGEMFPESVRTRGWMLRCRELERGMLERRGAGGSLGKSQVRRAGRMIMKGNSRSTQLLSSQTT